MFQPSPKPNPIFRLTRPILAGIVLVALVLGGKSLWNSLHNPNKIVDSCGNTASALTASNLLHACVSVIGKVQHVSALSNGNLQVQLLPSANSSYAVNYRNQALQNGDLLIELPCSSSTNTPSQYFQTCATFTKTVEEPSINTELTYTGNLVINPIHGWVEMQPISDTPGA